VDKQRDPLSDKVIGLAIEVHRGLGPGLLESIYEQCLSLELEQHGLSHARQVPLPIVYKTMRLDCGYRMDFVVEGRLVLELKAVERLLAVHKAQLLTYLKLSGHKTGLLFNFNEVVLKDGLVRIVY
jgi:GxxExxY protein